MKKNGEKIFWGLFFVLGGIFILIGQLGYLEDISVFKLLFAIFLAACFVKSLIHVEFTGILFSLAFIVILFDNELNLTAITPWPVLGAAVCGSIGLNMLFGNKRKDKHFYSGVFMDKDAAVDVEIAEDDSCSYHTTFGESIKYINSPDFKQASLDCTFGAMKIYFDHAAIPSGRAVVHMKVAFGGVELYVPKEWQIVNHTSAAFGAVDEKNHSRTDGSPILVLEGSISFGGVEIIYV